MSLAVVFIDGAEHYPRQDQKWKGTTNTTVPVSGVAGAHGLVNDDSVWGGKRFFLVTPSSKGSIRSRVIFRANSATGNSFISALGDSSHTHVYVRRNSDGTLSVVGPLDIAFTHTTVATYALNTWYEIEFRCRISNTDGEYLLKVGGVIPERSGGGLMYATGLDTLNGPDGLIRAFDLGNNNLQTYTDDAIIDSGKNNLGLGQVETLYPNAGGDLGQLTRGGTDTLANFSQCNESIADGFTTYVISTADEQRDCYSFPDLSITGQNYIVQVSAMLTHGSSGDLSFNCKLFLRINGANYDGNIVHDAVRNTQTCFTETWNLNPATASPWAIDDINSLQPGLYCIDNDVVMTQIVLEVAAITPTPDFVAAGFRNYCGSVDSETN